ncbi:MAG: DUF1801 domain-containing protein [Anaerolineae bacterium]|nr:DUF1801 domain-containing protein [Anaerolineae bacterium]MDQ7033553.1 DUF1801 domain-containing protein [Anaerolineae bacterium]
MSENKTRANDGDVMVFLNAVKPEKKREDSLAIMKMMEEVTGEQATMWGTSIVGFGSYHYKYESGREGDMMLVGFSPRKQAITLYNLTNAENSDNLLSKLGKYKTGKGCLYIKKTEDVDMDVLRELVQQSAQHMRETKS